MKLASLSLPEPGNDMNERVDAVPCYLHGPHTTDPPLPADGQSFAADPIAFMKSANGTGLPCTGTMVDTS